jgi:AcrR family transcriptional regulator
MDGMSTAGMGTASTVPGRRARTPSSDVERELISAAEQVLVREGPGGLTVRAVAAEAGIAPMGVYNRLGGKDGLIDALLIIGFDRLRTSIAGGDEPDQLERLRSCGLRYRRFALDNPHFYAIMFEAALMEQSGSPDVAEHAAAAFGALVDNVALAAAAGRITAPEPAEVAQQVWSNVHGAVALELKGLVLTPDPAATYADGVDTMLRGLAA